MKFVPLHVTSGYTFLSSGLTIDKIVSSTIQNKYFSCALTDKNVLYGVPSYVHKMKDKNLPYLVGMEVNVFNNNICLYAINEVGYLNLLKISSFIQKEEFNEEEISKYNEGLVAIIDTNDLEIKEQFLSIDKTELDIARYLNNIQKRFKYFYLGIELKERNELTLVRKIRKFAKEHDYECVAFPHILYQKEDDAIVLKICSTILEDLTLEEKSLKGNQYFMKLEDYQRIYTPKEIENTVNILNKSTFDFINIRGEMYHYSSTANDDLYNLCNSRLKELGKDNDEVYKNRLNYELDVISTLNYSNYFLMVKDYVDYARSQDILVGIRGSAAGSLVAYLLDIARIDPIVNNLQFERFLNPSRKTMPDIDIDFMDIRRNEVIDYVREKFGQNKVANITTFQTILAKQALRDIGRIYNYPTRHIDLLSKSLTNQKLSLRESYRQLPAFKELVDSDKYFLEIVSLASKIEGLPRQAGMHAAGVIINNDPLDDVLPVTYDFSKNLISQFEMNYLEEQGFLKMDFLGLNHLTVISNCVDLINKNHPDAHLDKFNIPYKDEKAIELIRSLFTMGIFQLESSGMKNAIKILKPTSFEDVAALLALFRPGPMQFITNYGKRKEGKEKIPYMDEKINKILGSTYGVITYQEQVTELAVVMANMSVTEADNFRRAISKKKINLISSMKKDFVEGAIKNGYKQKEIEDYFERMSRFAGYGFNKSHAYGYAYLSCQMAYLKAHYPLEFYSTILMNSSTTNDSKFTEYISEMINRNIKMLPPDINKSTLEFVLKDDKVLFPLSAIKGINRLTAENILLERKEGEFIDFFDFVLRMYKYKLSDVQISKLIDSGAFDMFSSSRDSLNQSIKFALQYAEINYNSNGQMSLTLDIPKPKLVDSIDDPIERLDKEYEALGIMISDNPLHYKKDILEKNNTTPLSLINDTKNNQIVTVAGIVRSKKVINTKKGVPMAFVKIFDETGELEVTIFPDRYKDVMRITDKNNILLIKGKIELNKDERTFIAENIERLEN